MGVQKVRLGISAWFDEREIEISFPSTWEVTERRMAGHDKPALSDAEMRAAMANPIGSASLSDMARGKRQVVILFDDLPKPTPAARIVPFVLEELHRGGITDDQIRFLCAPGTHRPMLYHEFAVKLGEEIVQKYPVYNHSIWDNLVDIGVTSRGTPILVNREYLACDLHVGIGSIIPHQMAGFGGGGKMILPGIAGMRTVAWHHTERRKAPDLETAGLNKIDGNAFRLDIEEAARMADLHFKVDAVLNNRREVVGLFAGDFVAEHRAGVRLAREVYQTELLKDMDILVSNGYPDECQFLRSTWPVPLSLREGGDVVLVNFAHSGQVLHQWSGRFGSDFGGGGWTPNGRAKNLTRAARVFVYAPFLAKADRMELGAPEKVIWCKEWGEVLAELSSRHGAGAKVGVYPYAPIQVEVK